MIKKATLSLATLSLVACVKAPTQPEVKEHVSPTERPNLEALFKPVPIDLSGTLGDRRQDEVARENSQKPIVYGEGAAGIRFTNTLQESENILSKPARMVPDGNSLIGVYDEGMYIYWRKDEPQLPTYMIIDSNYLGKIDAGGNIGKIGTRDELTKFYTEEDKNGENFLRELYRNLTGQDVDCLDPKQKLCDYGQNEQFYLYHWAKFGVLVSKDRKNIAEIRLINQPALGKLDNPFDLLSGTVHVGEGKTVALGQNWGDVLGTLENDAPFTTTNRNSFTKDFGGVVLSTTKSQFGREYLEPTPSETLKEIYLYSYINTLLVNGKPVLLVPDEAGVLQPEIVADTKDLAPDANLLTMNLDLPSETEEDQKKLKTFTKGLADFLAEQLWENSGRKAKVFSEVSGLHTTHLGRRYMGVAASVQGKVIKTVAFGVSSDSGDISFFVVNENIDPVNLVIGPHIDEVLVPAAGEKLTTLGGFTLGQAVTLKDKDLVRGEATLIMEGEGLPDGQLQLRVGYNPKTVQEAYYDKSLRLDRETVEGVSLPGVGLNLVKVQDNVDGSSQYLISAIGSSDVLNAVGNLCGMNMLVHKGDKDTKVKEAIALAMAQSGTSCLKAEVHQTDGTLLPQSVTFIDQGITLSFGDRELNHISIAVKPSSLLGGGE